MAPVMRARPILAIDVGSTKVAAVLARMQGASHFAIQAAAVARYPLACAAWPGEPEQIARAVEQALEQLAPAEPVDRALVAVTHPELSHHRTVAQVDLAEEPTTVREPVVRRLRAQAVAQALSIDRELLRIESLGYDGNGFSAVRDPRGLLATRLRGTFQVVAVPINLQRIVTRALETAGLEVERMVYSLAGVAAACLPLGADVASVGLDPAARSQRVLLLDLGGRAADAAILDRMVTERSATLAWGGTPILETLARECRMTLDQARAASLEGLNSPKPRVREVVRAQLATLAEGLQPLLAEGPLPDQAIVTGGAALIDGVVEWVEAQTGIPARLGRSPRAVRFGELPQQLALTAAIGLLELTCRAPKLPAPRPGRLGQLVHSTKTLLEEYF
jgi:cell division protein FtsA